jgi:hypothetical protein
MTANWAGDVLGGSLLSPTADFMASVTVMVKTEV